MRSPAPKRLPSPGWGSPCFRPCVSQHSLCRVLGPEFQSSQGKPTLRVAQALRGVFLSGSRPHGQERQGHGGVTALPAHQLPTPPLGNGHRPSSCPPPSHPLQEVRLCPPSPDPLHSDLGGWPGPSHSRWGFPRKSLAGLVPGDTGSVNSLPLSLCRTSLCARPAWAFEPPTPLSGGNSVHF